MRRLSSLLTFFFKFILVPLPIIAPYGIIIKMMLRSPSENTRTTIMLLIAFCALTVFILHLLLGRIKKVHLDGSTLHISNYRDTIQVDLSEVESVSGTIMWNPEMVWFTLKNPTIFGSKIYFIPRARLSFGYTKHPIVKELRELCNIS